MAQVTPLMECGDGYYRADDGSWGKSPVAKTAAYTVKATEAGTVFTNEAATGSVTFTLPTPQKGLWYTFVKHEPQYNIVLQAPTSVKINYGTAAQKYQCTTTTDQATVTILGISTTEYVVVAEKGTWSNSA